MDEVEIVNEREAALEGSSRVEARRRWRTKDGAEELNRGEVGKTERWGGDGALPPRGPSELGSVYSCRWQKPTLI